MVVLFILILPSFSQKKKKNLTVLDPWETPAYSKVTSFEW